MDTDHLALRRYTGHATPEDHVAWAEERLVEGDDTPSLRILAGLNPDHDRDDVEPYFQNALRELSLQLPAVDEAPRRAAAVVQRLFEKGALSAREVIDQMAELYRRSGYADPALRIWFDMDEELALRGTGHEGVFYPPGALEPLEAAVRTEWRLFEDATRLDLPERYHEFVRCQRCGHLGPARPKPGPLGRFLGRLWSRLRKTPFTVRFCCARCGSEEYRGMADPEVRSLYFRKLGQSE